MQGKPPFALEIVIKILKNNALRNSYFKMHNSTVPFWALLLSRIFRNNRKTIRALRKKKMQILIKNSSEKLIKYNEFCSIGILKCSTGSKNVWDMKWHDVKVI